MKILYNNYDLYEALINTSKLGLVPTMGSLHQGHISLINRSKKECKKTIISIFVNPTQFNNKKEFKKYPRNNIKDLSILKRLEVDFVYLPKSKHIYNSKKSSNITLSIKDKIMCAKYRKGHFEGVLDVMGRLTNIIKPKKIYMGEKDFQQLYLVKKHIEKKHKCKIITCKTIRDKNKLALSSRNLLLRKKDKIKAGNLTQNLINFKKNFKNSMNMKNLLLLKKEELKNLFNVKIEYLELRNIADLKISKKINKSKIFIAYYLNKVRLIDNI